MNTPTTELKALRTSLRAAEVECCAANTADVRAMQYGTPEDRKAAARTLRAARAAVRAAAAAYASARDGVKATSNGDA
jgi:hypothetical protein